MTQTEIYTLFYPAFRHYVGFSLGILWKRTRKDWLKLNPPNAGGLYICALCDRYIPKDEFSLDHIIQTSDDYSLRLELWNLQPAHKDCNAIKGMIIHSPVGLVHYRSLPLGTFERDLCERVVEQGIREYKNWRLKRETPVLESGG